MDAASTTVIEIDVVYKNKTGNGPKETANDINRIKRALDDTDRAGGRTRKSIEKIGSVLGNLARKTITIPIKIMDYATRPLRGLFQFATGIKGILTGLVVGKIGQEAIGKPLGLADAYTGAFTGFSTLFKDIEKGQQMMNSLDQFARTTPFKTSNVIAQAQKMMSMGWNHENLIQDMTIIGDAASATGKGDEGFERIALTLSQIKSKGKLSAEELNQLAEAGINAKAYAAEGLGLGTGDAGTAALEKKMMSRNNYVMGNDAVSAILAGMERDYGGMMEKMSRETVSGIRSNIADTLEINVFRKWGQGLQDGAKRGLGAVADMLDKNQEKLSKFGDQAEIVAASISGQFADAAAFVSQRAENIVGSLEFDQASVAQKMSMLWHGVVVDPIGEWWESKGRKQANELAGKIGEGMGSAFKGGILMLLGMTNIAEDGESLGSRFLNGFLKGFDAATVSSAIKSAMGDVFSSVGKLLPGGQSADMMSVLSGGLLAYGGAKIAKIFVTVGDGVQKVKAAVAKATAPAATTTAAGTSANVDMATAPTATELAELVELIPEAIEAAPTGATFLSKVVSKVKSLGAAGIGGTAGAAVGVTGLISAINDFVVAAQSQNSKEADVRGTSGLVKTTMIGLGTVIGSAIAPGIGTAIGAGIGGLASLVMGNMFGRQISDRADGTARMKKITAGLTIDTTDFVKAKEKTDAVTEAIERYYLYDQKISDLHGSRQTMSGSALDENMRKIEDASANQRAAIDSLILLYPDLISVYDIENGKLEDRLALIRKISSAELENARAKAEYALEESKIDITKVEEKISTAQGKYETYDNDFTKYREIETEVLSLQSDIQGFMKNTPNLGGIWAQDKIAGFRKQATDLSEKYNLPYSIQDYQSGDAGRDARRNTSKALNGRKQQGAVVEEQMGYYQQAYDAHIAVAKLPDGVNVGEMETKINQMIANKAKMDQSAKKLQDAKNAFLADGKTEKQFKVSPQYQSIQGEIDRTKLEQAGLQSEVEKFRPELEKVVAEIQRINTEFDMVPVEKQITFKVLVDYLESTKPAVTSSPAFHDRSKWQSSASQKNAPATKYGPKKKNGSSHIGDVFDLSHRKGFAVGTNNAPSGMAWVGERGPELVNFRGGERVFTAEQSKRMTENNRSWELSDMTRTARQNRAERTSGVVVQLGGIEIQLSSNGTEPPTDTLKKELSTIANNLSAELAVKLTQAFSNMPRRNVEGIL